MRAVSLTEDRPTSQPNRRALAARIKSIACLLMELRRRQIDPMKELKTAILARAGHELRTPVTVANLGLYALEEEVRSEGGRRVLDSAKERLQELAAKIGVLLLARLPQPV